MPAEASLRLPSDGHPHLASTEGSGDALTGTTPTGLLARSFGYAQDDTGASPLELLVAVVLMIMIVVVMIVIVIVLLVVIIFMLFTGLVDQPLDGIADFFHLME